MSSLSSSLPGSSSSNSMRWVAIVRDDTLLVQFPSSTTAVSATPSSQAEQANSSSHTNSNNNHQTVVVETARGLLNRDPGHGWDTFSTVKLWKQAHKDATTLRGLRFHVHQRVGSSSSSSNSQRQDGDDSTLVVLIWVYACVYDSAKLTKVQAQSFLEKLVLITELFRETEDWQVADQYEACQRDFCPILEQRVHELNCDIGMALTDGGGLEYCQQMMQHNKQIIKEQKQQRQQQLMMAAAAAAAAASSSDTTVDLKQVAVAEFKKRVSHSVGNLSSIMFKPTITSPALTETSPKAPYATKVDKVAPTETLLECPPLEPTHKKELSEPDEEQDVIFEDSHDMSPPSPTRKSTDERTMSPPLALSSPKDIISQCADALADCHFADLPPADQTKLVESLALPSHSSLSTSNHAGSDSLSGIKKLLFQSNSISEHDVANSDAASCNGESVGSDAAEARSRGGEDASMDSSLGTTRSLQEFISPLAPKINGILKRMGKDDKSAKLDSSRRRAFNKFQPKVASEEFKVLEIAAKKEYTIKAEVPFESEKLVEVVNEDDSKGDDSKGSSEPVELYEDYSVPVGQGGFTILAADYTSIKSDSETRGECQNAKVSSCPETLAIVTATTVDSDSDVSWGSGSSVIPEQIGNQASNSVASRDRPLVDNSSSRGKARHNQNALSVFRRKKSESSAPEAPKKLVDLSTGAEKCCELPVAPRTTSQTGDDVAPDKSIRKSYSDIAHCYDYLSSRSFSAVFEQNNRFLKLTTVAVIGAAVVFSRWSRESTR